MRKGAGIKALLMMIQLGRPEGKDGRLGKNMYRGVSEKEKRRRGEEERHFRLTLQRRISS